MILKRRRRCFHEEGEQSQAHAALFGLLGLCLAKRFQLGDVDFVVLGDMRNQPPRALHAGRGGPPDAAERPKFDGAKLGEVH